MSTQVTKNKKKKKKVPYPELQETLFPSFQSDLQEENRPGFVHETEVDLTFRKHNTVYLTHGFHSYPAKFIPQLPTWLMQKYSKEGDTILDPFAGSGTTLVEAVLNNRNCYGVEINPIGRLTSEAKSTPINPLKLQLSKDALYKRISSLMNKYSSDKGIFHERPKTNKFDLWLPKFENFDKWFLSEIVIDLAVIRKAIFDSEDLNFRTLALVAFSSIIKSVSNARTDERNPKLRKGPRAKPDTIRIFKNKLDKMSVDLMEFTERIKDKNISAKIFGEDARKLPLEDNSIDMIVTSPPYAYAMDYVRMHKLSLYWLGEGDLVELDKKFVGTERVYSQVYRNEFSYELTSIDDIIQNIKRKSRKKAYIVYKYFMDMQRCFEEMYRVLKPGGTATIVIGNSTVQKVTIPTHLCFNAIAEKLGFNVEPALERLVPMESKGLANVHSKYGGEMVEKEYINIFVK